MVRLNEILMEKFAIQLHYIKIFNKCSKLTCNQLSVSHDIKLKISKNE